MLVAVQFPYSRLFFSLARLTRAPASGLNLGRSRTSLPSCKGIKKVLLMNVDATALSRVSTMQSLPISHTGMEFVCVFTCPLNAFALVRPTL